MVFFRKSYDPRYSKYDVPHPYYGSEENSQIKDYELLSPCEFYRDFLDECRRGESAMTHMWIYNRWPNCEPWKTQYDLCKTWANGDPSKNLDILHELLEFERKLIQERSESVKKNDVWTLKTDGRNSWFDSPILEKVERNVRKLDLDSNDRPS